MKSEILFHCSRGVEDFPITGYDYHKTVQSLKNKHEIYVLHVIRIKFKKILFHNKPIQNILLFICVCPL